MKVLGYRTKMVLLGWSMALLFIPIGWSAEIAAGPPAVLQDEEEAKPCSPEPTDMTISYGDLVSCRIDPVGDTDIFRFAGAAGEVVVIVVARQGGLGRVDMELFDPDGKQVGSLGTRVDARLEKTGLYMIRVSGMGQPVSYALSLERITPPSPSATPLPSGQTLTAMLSPGGDIDLYFFRGASGDRVTIIAARQGGLATPLVELYDPEGNRIGGPEGQVEAQLEKAGIYTVRVNDVNNGNTGTYTIELQCTGECPPVGVVQSVLTLPLLFSGQADEGTRQTTFALVNTSSSAAEGTLKLVQPDGATPLNVTIGGTTDSEFPVSIPAGGVRLLETQGTRALARGLARLITDKPIRASVLIRSATRSGRVVFETSYGAPTPINAFTLLANSMGKDTDSGLVVFNPSADQSANLTLRRVDQNGQPVGSPVMFSVDPGKLSTGPKGEIIRFMSSDLFSGVSGINEFRGTLVVTSSIPVAVLAVQKTGGRLTLVPMF